MTKIIDIPFPYSELKADCFECGHEFDIDMVVGHLLADHHYSIDQTNRWIEDWMDSFDKDENGRPVYLEGCSEHGLVYVGHPCFGCEAVDAEIDRWQENHKREVV